MGGCQKSKNIANIVYGWSLVQYLTESLCNVWRYQESEPVQREIIQQNILIGPDRTMWLLK